MQINFFDGNNKFTIDKPIRLIELFAGYGSQAFALKYLGKEFEHWRTCEWAVKSIQAYKDAHFKDDNTDYSKYFTDEYILECLSKWGISANYNEPMTKEQIKRLGVQKQRQIYNNIKATHNLVNIQQVHAEDLEIVDTDKFCYVMTYSFPCQDLSSAGLGKGMEKGSGTRSGMLWEVERILDECENLPQVLLMENVPEVIGSNNIKHFAKWLEKLESLGYHCYWQVLNAKDYGVPQNRERCFMVSILGDYYYFPKQIKLTHKLKDLLETNVDESFYLSDKKIEQISNWKAQQDPLKDIDKEKIVSPTLTARGAGEEHSGMILINEDVYMGTYEYTKSDKFMNGKDRFKPNADIVGTLQTGHAEGVVEQNLKRQLCNHLIESGLAKEGDVVRHSYTNNRFDKYYASNQENHDCSPTLDTRCDCLGVVVDEPRVIGGIGEKKSNGGTQWYQQDRIYDDNIAISVTTGFNPYYKANLRIRKLTPKECFRLMGVRDVDFDNIAQNQSNASLYHLAGDSIVVDVLRAIFKNMF